MGGRMDLTRLLAAPAARMLRSRRLVRAPIWLFRARLGFLLGSRLLLLEHTGRVSGARRHVVLEIVDRPSPGSYVVASGFGERAQWWRNIRANPNVRVFIGGHAPRSATARVLAPDAARAAIDAYANLHPRAWRLLHEVLESTLDSGAGGDSTAPPLVCLETTTTAQPRASDPSD